jgi:cysteine desulfurase
MKPINFDQLACAPILTEVREAMMPFLSGDIRNPLSLHIFGEGPKKAIEKARNNIVLLIGSQPEEIIFASCGKVEEDIAPGYEIWEVV